MGQIIYFDPVRPVGVPIGRMGFSFIWLIQYRIHPICPPDDSRIISYKTGLSKGAEARRRRTHFIRGREASLAGWTPGRYRYYGRCLRQYRPAFGNGSFLHGAQVRGATGAHRCGSQGDRKRAKSCTENTGDARYTKGIINIEDKIVVG